MRRTIEGFDEGGKRASGRIAGGAVKVETGGVGEQLAQGDAGLPGVLVRANIFIKGDAPFLHQAERGEDWYRLADGGRLESVSGVTGSGIPALRTPLVSAQASFLPSTRARLTPEMPRRFISSSMRLTCQAPA